MGLNFFPIGYFATQIVPEEVTNYFRMRQDGQTNPSGSFFDDKAFMKKTPPSDHYLSERSIDKPGETLSKAILKNANRASSLAIVWVSVPAPQKTG